MKFMLHDWAFCATKKLKEIGYDLGLRVSMQVEGDIWGHAKKISDSGLNVMIYHAGEDMILFVDNKRFGQR